MKRAFAIVAALGVVSVSHAVTVFSENFDGGGTGVFTTTATNAAVAWSDMAAYGEDNYASTIAADQSNAMTADSDRSGTSTPFDSWASAAINGTGYSGLVLTFDLNFIRKTEIVNPSNDRFEVYANNTLLGQITSNVGLNGGYNSGVTQSFNLGAFNNSNFTLKFRYVDETSTIPQWYAQVDNVRIASVPEPAEMYVLSSVFAAMIGRRIRRK